MVVAAALVVAVVVVAAALVVVVVVVAVVLVVALVVAAAVAVVTKISCFLRGGFSLLINFKSRVCGRRRRRQIFYEVFIFLVPFPCAAAAAAFVWSR